MRALSRSGKDRQAIPRYRAFAKRYPKSSLAPDALYLAAWLSARENLPNARKELADFATSEVGWSASCARSSLRIDGLCIECTFVISSDPPPRGGPQQTDQAIKNPA